MKYKVYATVKIKWSVRKADYWLHRTIQLGEFEIRSFDQVENTIFFLSYLALAKAKNRWKTLCTSEVRLSFKGEKYGERAYVVVDLVDKVIRLRVYEKTGVFKEYLRFIKGKKQKKTTKKKIELPLIDVTSESQLLKPIDITSLIRGKPHSGLWYYNPRTKIEVKDTLT